MSHPWYVVVVREPEPFEDVVIGPFEEEESARKRMNESIDVEDWCYTEAKAKGYIVDDVYITQNPAIPSYGVNEPVIFEE